MKSHTFTRTHFFARALLCAGFILLLFGFEPLIHAQDDQQEIMPARGFHPSHSYSFGDIETINTTSGNLALDIPLASLPPGRGGHPGFQLRLKYNSKIWDGQADVAPDPNNPNRDVNVVWLVLSDEGGWRYNIPKRYYFHIDNRNNHGVIYPPSDIRSQHIWKLKMMFPDGSARELRPYGFDDGFDDGYFGVLPAAGMSYYSTDGSYIRLDIGSNGAWTLNFPTGNRVVNQSDGTQREMDRLGNFIQAQQVSNYNGTGHAADIISDQLGRSLVIEHGTNEDYIHATGFNGAPITLTVKWTNTFVNKIYRAGNHFQYDATLNRAIKVVGEIDLPVQLGAGQKYLFGYNGWPSSGMGTSVGWGELNSVTLPSGANATYQYELDNGSGTGLQANFVLENSPTRKDLNYSLEYDGTTVAAPTETWTYSLGNGFAGVTSPDGGTTSEWFSPSPNRGRVYKLQKPDGSVIERIWKQNRPFLPAGVTIWSGAIVNPFVEDEFTSIPDATGNLVLTAARHFTYDKNGNLTSTREYDWIAYSTVPRDAQGKPTGIPASAPLKRVTTSTYYSDTPDSTNTTTNDPDSYDKSTAPRLLNLLKSLEIGSGTQALARTEFTYDNSLTTGKLTVQRSWDSTKGANSNPLTTSNSIALFYQYDAFGNRTMATDARGNQTKLIYGSVGTVTDLYPTQTIGAFGTTIQRVENTDYDFHTGLVTRTTDVDNNVASESDYDALGRVTESRIAANVPAAKSVTRTEYSNIDRRVITRSDLNTAYDGKIVQITHFDQLGRVRLTRQLEDAANESVIDESTGVKVQTRYLVNNPCLPTNSATCLQANSSVLASYRIVSNPYRAATSSGASSEETMGWSRTRVDRGGRTVETQTFGGPSLPAPWAGNTSSTGTTTFAYDGTFTTVTDQAGKVRRSTIDALGRMVRVDEPAPDSTNLGSTSAPVQPTGYSYDALGNLLTVSQGVQTRTFVYSSLSRMTSATNPEASNAQDVPIATIYGYDNNGNLTQRTDARGVVTTYGYDELNRMLSRSYSDATPAVTYGYDVGSNAKGRLTSVTSSVSTYTYASFDANGRVLSATQTTDGVPYVTGYAYNLAGALTSKTYPSGRIVASEYDNGGRLGGVKHQQSGLYYAGAGSSDINRMDYAPHGVVRAMRFGNGLWEHAKFNSRLQITEIGLGSTSANSSMLQLNYNYGGSNNNGNVQSHTITVPTVAGVTGFTAVQNYTYDELNRLNTAQENGGSSWVQNFDYDRYGNRSFISGTTFPSPLAAMNNPAIKAINNRINPGAAGQGSVTYDNAGNLTRDVAGHSFTYDAENRQTTYDGGAAVGGTTYVYDGDGRRIKKISGSVTTLFVHDVEGRLIAEYTTGTPTPSGTRYLTTDRLGSLRLVTDASQTIKARHDYAPFGEELPNLGGRTLNQQYGPTLLNQKFTGKERDAETSLDYFLARYYSSAQGRFTSVDPANAGAEVENPQSWNAYTYTLNNPITNTDPDGLKFRICGTDGQCTSGDYDLSDEEFERYFRNNKNIVAKDNKIFENGVQIGTYRRISFDDLNDFANGVIFGRGRTAGLSARLEPVQTVVTYGAIIDVGLIAGVTIGIELAGTRIIAGACFVAGTPVHTDHGSVAIEDIKPGDQVLSFNEFTHQTEYKTVTQTFVRDSEVILSIVFAGESEPIGATPRHPFYTRIHKARDNLSDEGEWLPAGKLSIGDEVRLAAGGWARVLEIKRLQGHTTVYNFEVADNHDYFVGQSGLLVHNQGCWMEIKEAARKMANDVLKAAKEAQRGTGQKSGEGGNPFMQAARQLRELLKKHDKDWLPEFKEQVQKKIDEFTRKGQDINHPNK